MAVTVTVAVLAGGDGRRIGGAKASLPLAGTALLHYPLRAASAAGLDAVVVAKRRSALPRTSATVILEDDDLPTHPLSGILTALERFPAVVAIPCDMPLVPAAMLLALAQATGEVVAAAPGQPFPGLYSRGALAAIRRALTEQRSLRELLVAVGAATLPAIDSALLLSVNTRADLERARQALA